MWQGMASTYLRRLEGGAWRRHGPLVLEYLAMAGVLALAAYLDFWRLRDTGFGNLYYAAAVRSMAESWHTFFYVSYDPGGFVSIDKPPLGFWLQVASVKLFGYTPFNLLAPEALAGVCSVVALWRVVRRSFGPVAGIVAALALAVTPVNVVANRDNIVEPLLTLTLLLATWATLVATKRASLLWLILAAALIGLGFNVKALEAYLVLPALAALYMVSAPLRWRMRLAHLALAGAIMLAISFAWITAVDLTPASQRPYIGSSATNSELELTLGYNGLLRFFGGSLTPPRPTHPHHSSSHGANKTMTKGHRSVGGVSAPSSAGKTACQQRTVCPHKPHKIVKKNLGAPSALGKPGPLRLWQTGLGAQVGWLLPLALFSLFVVWRDPRRTLQRLYASISASLRAAIAWPLRLWQKRAPADAPIIPSPRGSEDQRTPSQRQQGYVLWGVWLLTQGVFFSAAHFINAYYTAVLAPAICALAGVGVVRLWQAYTTTQRRGGWRGWLLPLAVLATGIEQVYLMSAAQGWQPWLHPLWIVGPIVLALTLSGLLLVSRWRKTTNGATARHRFPGAALAAVALLALLLAPTFWSASSLTWGNAGGWPVAGPEYARAEPKWDPLVDPYLIRYLEAHRDGARYLVATVDTYTASPIIIATGQPVMAMGGFSGADPILTPGRLTGMIERGEVKFFLLPSSNVTPEQYGLLFPASAQANTHSARSSGVRAISAKSVAPPQQQQTTRYTNNLTRLVSGLCAPVKPTLWSSATYARKRLGAFQLYSCGHASALDHHSKPSARRAALVRAPGHRA